MLTACLSDTHLFFLADSQVKLMQKMIALIMLPVFVFKRVVMYPVKGCLGSAYSSILRFSAVNAERS